MPVNLTLNSTLIQICNSDTSVKLVSYFHLLGVQSHLYVFLESQYANSSFTSWFLYISISGTNICSVICIQTLRIITVCSFSLPGQIYQFL